jgi:hypothetical protein
MVNGGCLDVGVVGRKKYVDWSKVVLREGGYSLVLRVEKLSMLILRFWYFEVMGARNVSVA